MMGNIACFDSGAVHDGKYCLYSSQYLIEGLL